MEINLLNLNHNDISHQSNIDNSTKENSNQINEILPIISQNIMTKVENLTKNLTKNNENEEIMVKENTEELSRIVDQYSQSKNNENIIQKQKKINTVRFETFYLDSQESDNEIDDTNLIFKVLIIGNQGYGKTSIVQRLSTGTFSSHYRATIGVDFALKEINIGNKNITFQLWDIAGHERFGSMTNNYYRGAIGAFIVIDITQLLSLDTIKSWKMDLEKKVKLNAHEDISVILLINKVDLDKNEIEEKMITAKCLELGIKEYIYTSAKENIGIDFALLKMTTLIMKHPSFRSCTLFSKTNINLISSPNKNNILMDTSKKCCTFS
jgi:small GTP-binding protein